MQTTKLPDHITATPRVWGKRKRAECRAVLSALDAFRMGCAYTPATAELNAAATLMREAHRKLMVKNWRIYRRPPAGQMNRAQKKP